MRAKKSLGQHFLTSHEAVRDIVRAADIQKGEWVLEIGPGQGFLTRELLEAGARVLAIETDPRMIEHLHDLFPEAIETDQLIVLHRDVLEFRPSEMNPYIENGIKDSHYKVVANIPYYITGAILRHFLQSDLQPERMVLLIQKEVADRIVSRDGKESILSISVKVYGKPKVIRRVSRKLFNPPPKVDSAVLLISHISKKYFSDISEGHFFEIIKQAFSQKRKQLSNTLGIKKEILKDLGFDGNVRAEDLSPEEFKQIVTAIDRSQ